MLALGLVSAPAGWAAAKSSFSAHGSVEQVYVTGLSSHAKVSLLNSHGHTAATIHADSLGGALFRKVRPGAGYRVTSGGHKSGPITVHSTASAPWDPKTYNQKISPCGYQYLTTRDGIKLALTVNPPTGIAGVAPAPCDTPPPPGGWPTLIEYSGYAYADPAGPTSGIAALANVMGFAVVDISMRGTGCSGGAFDFFEPLQSLDGYDIIQTIAHQSWVQSHKVGMMGISYGGISQLFTAQTDPPALEAIAPLSVIDTTATTLYPGGILNTGFAVAWSVERQEQAQVAGAKGTQPYAESQIKAGDKVCKANQVLHGEAANLMAKIHANSHYHPKVADPLDPITFVHKIHVPVFMACQWTDEQTGGHCPDLVQHFTGTKQKWFNFTNGAHIDSLDPETYNHWYDFLELFVAHQAPMLNASKNQGAAPLIYQAAFGISDPQNATFPPDPVQQTPVYSSALSAFKKIPEVRVLFDNGAGESPNGQSAPGDPYPGFTHYFPKLPVPGTKARWWFFGAHGRLAAHAPRHKGVNHYTTDAHALPLTDYKGEGGQPPNTGTGGLWGNASQWAWSWKQNPAGTAVSYVSAPLKKTITVVGAGAIHVWIRSSARDVDLQATLSEVRPDHKETFVQDGWMRASERKLSTSANNIFKQRSTLLAPIPSELPRDVKPLPKGKFAEVVIPLYYEGHVYRKGSRVRVTIAAPNGAQPIWSFDFTRPGGKAKVSVAFSKKMPSSLILPVVPLSVPTGLPACPSLRNEDCRPYKAFKNQT
ncbi:MAG: CocE/NonD family hydrolase [Solirubrobacteraceae bacterium]